MHLLVHSLKLFCSLSSITLLLSTGSVIDLYINITTKYLYFFVIGSTTMHEIMLHFYFCIMLLFCVHMNTAKVNILKSWPRLCPLCLYEDKAFFTSLFQETITALIYLPSIKCWWVPVSSGWHLFHQRSRSRGRVTLMEERKKELLAYPSNGCGRIVKQSRLPSR